MDYTFVFREGDDIDKFGREVEKAVKAELKKEGFPVGCLKWELNQLGLAFSEIAFAWIRAERLEKAVLWDVESDGRTL
jgi:hypothetical protein